MFSTFSGLFSTSQARFKHSSAKSTIGIFVNLLMARNSAPQGPETVWQDLGGRKRRRRFDPLCAHHHGKCPSLLPIISRLITTSNVSHDQEAFSFSSSCIVCSGTSSILSTTPAPSLTVFFDEFSFVCASCKTAKILNNSGATGTGYRVQTRTNY
jgi:hypothetical protein